MSRARRATISTAVLAAALAVPTTALASSPAHTAKTTSPGCKTGQVPDEVKGKPAVKGGATSGEYVGHDGKGWTLFVTHPVATDTSGNPVKGKAQKVVFSGRITSTKPMHYVQRKLEKADQVFISHDRRTILYRFTNYGHLDGLRFVADCSAKVTFSLNTGKAKTPVSNIFLGTGLVHPTTNPFSELRTPVVTPSPSPSPTSPAPTSPSPSASPATTTAA